MATFGNHEQVMGISAPLANQLELNREPLKPDVIGVGRH